MDTTRRDKNKTTNMELVMEYQRTCLGQAKGKSIVVLGDLGVNGSHGIDLHGNFIPHSEGQRLDARNVECANAYTLLPRRSERMVESFFMMILFSATVNAVCVPCFTTSGQ